MKKVILIFITSFCIGTIYSQKTNGFVFGFKAGLNYNSNGDYIESIDHNAQHPDRNIGYHFGLFGKVGKQIYVRPEVIFTQTKSDYSDDSFNMQKIDVPLLAGIKVIGPLSIFGGPSFQFILDSEFDNISVNNIENDFSVGLNFGVGLDINKLGLDLRYERGINSNEANFLNNNGISTSRLDTRPDQLILSLSLVL